VLRHLPCFRGSANAADVAPLASGGNDLDFSVIPGRHRGRRPAEASGAAQGPAAPPGPTKAFLLLNCLSLHRTPLVMPENPDVGLARPGKLGEMDGKLDARSGSRIEALPAWQNEDHCRLLQRLIPGRGRRRHKTLDRPEEMRKSSCLTRISCDCMGRGSISLAMVRSRCELQNESAALHEASATVSRTEESWTRPKSPSLLF